MTDAIRVPVSAVVIFVGALLSIRGAPLRRVEDPLPGS